MKDSIFKKNGIISNKDCIQSVINEFKYTRQFSVYSGRKTKKIFVKLADDSQLRCKKPKKQNSLDNNTNIQNPTMLLDLIIYKKFNL